MNELAFVTRETRMLQRFGKGDERKLKSYLLMLAAFLEGRPENTKRSYKTAIRQFFEMFDWICPEDVTVAHAVAFKKRLGERVGDATVYYRISALKSFFDFLRKPAGATEQALITSNPFDLVPRSDIKPTPYGRATVMDWPTFMKIYDAIPSDPLGLRDKAILLFFAFTGRRRTEVASLRIRDLDLKSTPKKYTVRVKGGEVKTWQLPQICYDALKAYWIASDRLSGLQPDDGVFTASDETPLTSRLEPNRPLASRTMNEILLRAARRAGVDRNVAHIHALRHMSARDLDEAGVRLQDIQEFLGHLNPNTTAIYLQKIGRTGPAHEERLIAIREAAEKLAMGLRSPG